MKGHQLYIFLILFSIQATAQEIVDVTPDSIQAKKDIIDVFNTIINKDSLKKAKQTNKKVFFSFMPLSGSSSGDGIAVSSVNASFYLGEKENTNLSNVSFYPSTNFESRFQFKIIPYLWLSNNSWFIPGKIEISYNQQDNYGLGANTSKDSLTVINYNLVRFYFSVNREIYENYFVGMGYNFDDFSNIDEVEGLENPGFFKNYPYGTSSKSVSSGISFNVFYDSRKNIINPLKGLYANMILRFNSTYIGSDYNWQSVFLECRKYINFNFQRHRTLAFWGIYYSTFGQVPYLNLPGTGLDFSGWTGRGYKRARYRGNQMLYGETEYRFDITRNGLWGGVLFVNAQTYTEVETGKFQYINPAVGIGCRLKFNKYSDSNMTFDFAIGQDSYNWYVGLNEAF